MDQRVLVVDDEASIRTLLEYNLKKEGYQVDLAVDGQEGLDKALNQRYDFIILDLMLPKMDGADVCKAIRAKDIDVPIMMLTAKDDETDKVVGLEIGADDYMVKPFSPRELTARMKAIRRRYRKNQQDHNKDSQPTEDESSECLKVGDIEIYYGDYEVFVRGEAVDMTPKEFELLYYMANRVNRTLSREQLLQKIWEFDYNGGTRIVDVHISHLREKIERNTKKPEYIITVRGFGYKFEVPDS
ncbi:two-component system response regulator [Aerococcus urinaehominis]|uniref:Two-component system response regulator n=1 Tax=Aerococcus urinaehominis TaxID=128944 RepID=A0A0X8FLB1_9LACT|nr:response regulator transcription factor [Aerococcus urinaehominis]AMB99421.1 two-component system response regulator [Aerococcus urinaehominis]SDM29770.1 two-component system, OmpR family, alkaline phosphatase synthesis response regulator PhoP [Aerococcus urinaehominis]